MTDSIEMNLNKDGNHAHGYIIHLPRDGGNRWNTEGL